MGAVVHLYDRCRSRWVHLSATLVVAGNPEEGVTLSPFTRREFLAAGTATVAALAAAVCSGETATTGSNGGTTAGVDTAPGTTVSRLPDPARAPFDTVVVLMLENRRSTNCSGGCPARTASRPGSASRATTRRHLGRRPTAMGHDFQACGDKDPAHDWEGDGHALQRRQVRRVAARRRSPATTSRSATTSSQQVPILGALAQNYTLFDNYHCSLMAATWPNRFYQLCAATDIDDTGLFPGADATAAVEARARDLRPRPRGRPHERLLHWGEPMTGLFQSQPVRRHHPPKDAVLRRRQGRDAAERHVRRARLRHDRRVPRAPRTTTTRTATSRSARGTSREVYNALRKSPQWERMVFVAQLRRERRLLRPRRTADGERRQRQPEPGSAPRLQAARVPRAVPSRWGRSRRRRSRPPVRTSTARSSR